MSTVLLANPGQNDQLVIRPNSLLDYLYTYFSLGQLHELLTSEPSDDTLSTWNMSTQEYKAQVRIAIKFVACD